MEMKNSSQNSYYSEKSFSFPLMIIRVHIPMLPIARNTRNIEVVPTPAIAIEVVPTPAPP